MHYSSFCRCGQIQVNLSLPKPIDTYAPRACDCDFCTSRSASYLSDPDGMLQITKAEELEQLKQGSGQAIFWQCKSCHDLIGVTHEFKNGIQGTVNANLFAEGHELQSSIAVSPKTLSPEIKRERWREVWMKVKFTP
ncbi:aldehyde-activating protein [Desulfopila sp. IMCC35008]|uniref:aldehyde-activating protein n=1 Tax=Desulfopila sp. IMCC35008 TaxID=2653858 RepID=UPI0013D33EF5|nr:aldehyde-activating protein [Desulfopila sp. IMCC35008]